KLQEEDFPCSVEELELIFDGLDDAGTGRLSTEEFAAGLRQFLSSQKAARDHRRRKTASRRVRLVLPSPALEGVDSEEQRRFAAFMEQLGTDNVPGEQEVWQLWVKLRQEEPQLLSNLDDFLAKLRHRIQEARSKKEALEVALSKRIAEHDKEVQQLCKALEQQIQEGKQRLEQESVSWSQQHGWELQQALDASEREVQRLVTAQKELETRCHSLRSTQQAPSTENRQLEERNQVLEDQLQQPLHRQLQQTRECLQSARAAVARERAEETGGRAVVEVPSAMPMSPQMSPEKSEKYHSEMQIRLGSQGGEPKAKSTHQVHWLYLPKRCLFTPDNVTVEPGKRHTRLPGRGAGLGQGEGAGVGVQPWEEAESLDMLEDLSTGANEQLMAEVDEHKQTPGGGPEADLQPLTAAALYPERATADGPDLEEKMGALTGPAWQIPEDTQTLGLLQGERAAAEGRPLDGAQGLEEVQGERQEAGTEGLVKTYDPGLKQGHDDGVSELASPVSEVPLQISTLKLEMMMQEDVLIPDVWRLGTPGQASQSELQEQVSAQADKVRLHTASQQLEEKPPHVMETEHVAAGPAEPPKQEVPPASTLNARVQQEEDAGNHQLGMVLGGSSLGAADNSSVQPQRQLLGEHSEDLNVGQQGKRQEVGRKTSHEGKPGPGEPRAVTADGAGAAPRGSPDASLDPDHLYNVLFVGDSHVGKTSFLYRLQADTFNPHLTATVGLDYQVKHLVVDNRRFALRLWDSAGQERYRSITKQFFRKADGVVLMYDITSEYSFSDVRYWLSCIQEGAEEGVTILLLGNKTDCAAERQVPTEEGERLAKEHQLIFFECSAASGHNVSESMVSLI
ncbi:PREDICTED: ras-related protein Rab-44, partial [Eurypyga helias]|uniref:ras-related protein Rab-44 n=1 Tax=Eurypyga helias TaxID=54383 RepID=UPI0005283061